MSTLTTKIFLDGGDPLETKKADTLLKSHGFPGIQGQTTNPSLIVKNLSNQSNSSNLSNLTNSQAFLEYKRIVTEMAKVTSGPISIQVILSPDATAEDMLTQARDRLLWIPNAVIKFPCTEEGLKAAEVFCQEGSVNITLNFSQAQAAAVYAATKFHNYEVFVSPFVGRLDDRGEKGMDVVANILEMYRGLGDGHVQVLTASVRTLDHFLYALKLKSDVVTVPYKILEDWCAQGCPIPGENYLYQAPGLSEIPYQELSLDDDWKNYDLSHDLTTTGVSKFWSDWTQVVNV